MTDKEESPFIEEGKKSDEKPVDETAQLLAELKSAGVATAEDLQGKLEASKKYGQMAFKLGEERKVNEALLKRIEAIENRASQASSDDLDYGQPVDLQAEIRKGIKSAREEERREQENAQRMMMETYNRIQSDQDFKLVKKVWEEKLKDPNFVFGIQSGQVNPLDEYYNTVRGYYKGIAQKAADTIEKLSGSKRVATPVVEEGARMPEREEEENEKDEVLKSYGEKVNKGGQLTEAEELAALTAALTR